jgi:serine/threonine protein kinase
VRNNHYEPYVQADIVPFFQKTTPAVAKSPELPAAVEKKVGKYVVRRKLGAGASGVVYEATDPSNGEKVAVKMLVSDGDPFREAQFKREIEMLGRTEPIPNVVKVLDLIREHGQQGLVLEYADGGSLHDYVTKQTNGRLSAIEAKNIAIDLAETLQQIHDLQIVHRDLKPDNVLRVSGVWKIGDYGISKYLPRPYTQQTLQGAHSPGYSAPEQISGAEAAPSADIFSLGKVCLFMLEGSPDEAQLKYVDSPGWKKLIQDCIGMDVKVRPSCMAEVRDRLKYV